MGALDTLLRIASLCLTSIGSRLLAMAGLWASLVWFVDSELSRAFLSIVMLFLVVYTVAYALPYFEMKREAHRPGAIPAQMPGFLDETVIESVTLEFHEQQMKEKDDASSRLREQLHEAEKAAELAKHSFPPARPPPAR
ncbi:hypothetical protein LTS18_014205, partial [Coniosporium uncinatum]